MLAIPLASAPLLDSGPPSITVAVASTACQYRFLGEGFSGGGKASAGVREKGWLVSGRIGRAGRVEGRIGDAIIRLKQGGIVDLIIIIVVTSHAFTALYIHTIQQQLKGSICIAIKPTRFEPFTEKMGVFIRAHYTE